MQKYLLMTLNLFTMKVEPRKECCFYTQKKKPQTGWWLLPVIQSNWQSMTSVYYSYVWQCMILFSEVFVLFVYGFCSFIILKQGHFEVIMKVGHRSLLYARECVCVCGYTSCDTIVYIDTSSPAPIDLYIYFKDNILIQ